MWYLYTVAGSYYYYYIFIYTIIWTCAADIYCSQVVVHIIFILTQRPKIKVGTFFPPWEASSKKYDNGRLVE